MDLREDAAEQPPIERVRTEQAPPPPAMPISRGMTYTMEQAEPYYHHPSWVASGNGIFRNAALLDVTQ